MVSIHDMTANTDGILDFLQEFKQNVQVGTDIFTVGEANGVQPEDLPAWVGENGVFDMIFEFNHLMDTDPDAMFDIIIGTKKGETISGPFSSSFLVSLRVEDMPPIPEPM